MPKIRNLLFILTLAFSLPALALDLSQAKAGGLVGEQSDGYLGSVSASPNAEVSALILDINQKRRAAYQQRASKAGVPLKTMAQRVGQRLIQKTAAGLFIKTPNGRWQKK